MAYDNYEPYQPPYSPALTSSLSTRTPPPNNHGAPLNPSTAIFIAIQNNDVGHLRALLSQTNFDLNMLRDRDGRTPLMAAAFSNSPDVVRFLLSIRTLDINLKDIDGESALYQASLAGNAEIVDILIGAGAFVESKNKEAGSTPLIVAAYNGHAIVCGILLDRGGADVNCQDYTQKTALALAAVEGHYDVVKVLLSRGAQVNAIDQEGWSVLMLAAYGGSTDVCRLLLDHNADKTITMRNGKTATSLALAAGHETVAHLIDNYIPGQSPPPPIAPPFMPPMAAPMMPQTAPPGPPYNQQQFPPQGMPFQDDMYAPRGLFMPLDAGNTRRVALRPKNAARQAAYQRADPNGFPTSGESRPIPRPKQDMKPREDNSPWVIFSLITTCCFCNICLSSIAKMKDPNIRQAWREKVALCVIILLISAFMGFLTFGLSTLACQKKVPLYEQDILRLFGPDAPGQKVHIVRGKLYNTGVYFLTGSHRPIAPFSDNDLNPIISQLFGSDISGFFPIDYNSIGCNAPQNNGPICTQGLTDKRYHCHTSRASQLVLKSLSMNTFVGFTWENITRGTRDLFVYNENVYDMSDYLNPKNTDFWLGDDTVTAWIRGLIGRDATKDIVHAKNTTQIAKCFEHFKVGLIDGTTIGCFATNLVLVLMIGVFTGITIIKFVSAMAFDWFLSWQLGKVSKKPKPNDAISNILLLVTCYSEGEQSMRATLDSLAKSTYSDEHKLLFVIADGDITGSENDRSTPQICIDLLEPQFPDAPPPEPQSYIAIGDGKKQHNMAQVYTGYYKISDHRVPMIVIVKCGTPEERKGPKAGNRGKRDSQLILMRWLSHICFNEAMCPLEYELFEKIRHLTGVTPDKYEMVLMVDADTLVKPDSVSRMVAAMERDPKVMGLCGETKIANKAESWVTMIQVFEYYISHHLGKAFESIFGGVTCLPGCFCMYRIKAPKYEGYFVPIIANPDIVEAYSSNTVETLHQKNLLLLGEDRYLTTLMLRTFPKRKMIYVPKAICKTVVPDEFKVLLSQRRRWINSTVHNLMELILVPQLCGIFCCSMQFVIFLELIGSIVMPSSLIFLAYLLVCLGLGQDVVLPLIFVAIMFFLPSFLIVLSSRRVMYLLWMIVYVFALPIWNFVLPVYAFWHFDDFSWGATRKIAGVDNGHGDGGMDVFDPKQVPMRKWHEWKMDEGQRRFAPKY
ncbi:10216_t:CDS:2 [Paraglomus brasilianum]|uniref:chitin synthase n=1 Tax=Paraglomus brasilianum TaxID=144538 RepID=A0A9N9CUP1_9GLOM|nr:10216_t:CDS:2 [Paraglomus brasilianum]